jgi:hypothetical protein
MSMEYGMNNTDKEMLKYLKKNLPKCHFIYHKSYLDCPGIQPGPQNDMLVTLPEPVHGEAVNSRWF